ncbi:MAG: DUF4139 domain-containing protein [Anaerolineae bacterium]|jgi:hypothetical protein|nr:DUF4139 domain-containing protein [Chloroflexota bacterium]
MKHPATPLALALIVVMLLVIALPGMGQRAAAAGPATPTAVRSRTVTPTVEPSATEPEEEAEPTETPTDEPTATPVPTDVPTATPTATQGESTEDEEGMDTMLEAGPATQLELTIYSQGLGLVRQVRSADLSRGLNELRISEIPRRILPASVFITPLDNRSETTLIEQRFDYDVVSAENLLGRYVDQTITVLTVPGESITGVLLAAADDLVIMTDWGIEIVRAPQVQQISLPALAQPPLTRPTLTWLLDAPRAGTHEYRLSYLTEGLAWQADYVAMLQEGEQALDLQSWVSIRNDSGAPFADAKLKLVAGDLHVVDQAPMYAPAAAARPEAEAMAMDADIAQRGLMDYYLYDIGRPVSLSDAQSKQLEFMSAQDVAVEKQYILEITGAIWVRPGDAVTEGSYWANDTGDVRTVLQIVNDQEHGLGMPLPSGTVRLYKEDVDGSPLLVGEDTIRHTPEGAELELNLGSAVDLAGERKQTRFRQLGERSLEETIQITLRNYSEEDRTIQVIEHLFRARDAEIKEASAEYTTEDANTIRFAVDVEAGGEATVTYTVLYRW